jgi:hypothetical protein
MEVRQKPCPITAPSRPQRGGGVGDVTVNKKPPGAGNASWRLPQRNLCCGGVAVHGECLLVKQLRPTLSRMTFIYEKAMSLNWYSDFSNLKYLAISFLLQPDASKSRHSFA